MISLTHASTGPRRQADSGAFLAGHKRLWRIVAALAHPAIHEDAIVDIQYGRANDARGWTDVVPAAAIA